MPEMLAHFQKMFLATRQDAATVALINSETELCQFCQVIERIVSLNVTPSAIVTTAQFHFTAMDVYEAFGPTALVALSPPGTAMHISKYSTILWKENTCTS